MTPVEVLRAWFAAHARNDLDAARALVVDDLVVDLPEARLRGFDAFMAWYGERVAKEGPAFTYEVEDLLDGERHAAAVLRLSNGEHSWRQVALYAIEDGRISELWAREDEP